MERKIRVGAVSYLNTKPFIYGLEHGPIKDEIELILDYPANLVKMLKSDQIDIGLVPVGALPSLGEYHIISDYCIGTEGEVASVAVFSEVPMEQIEQVYLDYQSRTSVLLCRLLFEKHWKKNVRFIDAKDEGYLDQIKGTTAGLIIGDRALMNYNRFKFVYDLGLGWKEMTGLPFVFAVWVSLRKLNDKFLKAFDESISFGILDLNQFINEENEIYKLEKYYTKNLSYLLDNSKKAGMAKFFKMKYLQL
ncbi:MAG: menaquinone biosynthetic enzyme MqnA/MqnD family protein [Bacteroidota bacterium]